LSFRTTARSDDETWIRTGTAQHRAKRGEASWSLEFPVPNHAVTVSSDGRILVDGALQRTVTALDARS